MMGLLLDWLDYIFMKDRSNAMAFQATPPIPDHAFVRPSLPLELTAEWSDEEIILHLGMHVGEKGIPTATTVRTIVGVEPPLLTGPHGFVLLLVRDYVSPDEVPSSRPESNLAAVKRAVKEFRKHCAYHETLNKMVEERMEQDAKAERGVGRGE